MINKNEEPEKKFIENPKPVKTDDDEDEIGQREEKLEKLRKDNPTMDFSSLDQLLHNGYIEKFDHFISLKMILNLKRTKVQEHENLKRVIIEELGIAGAAGEKYPAYFTELLQNGYIYLCDHLIKMRKKGRDSKGRDSIIENISFSELSHVILETRQAIIRRVESRIPANHSNILFLLGGTGAGKSTTMCYLRGDDMIFDEPTSTYSSIKDAEFISDDPNTSCTFLPNRAIVARGPDPDPDPDADLVIVDFPGFEDSNGWFVNLGIEFALKALILKYQPKILVLESITSTGKRMDDFKKLGERLGRLISTNSKQECMLGLTKYTQERRFNKIAEIEKEQRRRAQDKPTVEEEYLQASIIVKTRKNPRNPKIQELQQELDELRQQRGQDPNIPLPETDDKRELRDAIKRTEDEMTKQAGLKSGGSFSNLANREERTLWLAELSKKKGVHLKSEQILDDNHEGPLRKKLEELARQINEHEYNFRLVQDFKSFGRSILESSLINVLLSQSAPGIGELLHLSEMNPKLVREYDKRVARTGVDICLDQLIGNLDVIDYKAMVAEGKEKKTGGSSLSTLLTIY